MAMAATSSVYLTRDFKHAMFLEHLCFNDKILHLEMVLQVVLNLWPPPNNNKQTQTTGTCRSFLLSSAAMTSVHSGLVTADEVEAAQQKDRRWVEISGWIISPLRQRFLG